MAALALLTALAIALWGPAEAQAHCNDADAVPDSTNSELVGDCNTLLSLMGTLAGTANLNWSENTPISSWNGITLSGSPQRVTGLELPSPWSLSGSIPSGLGDLSSLTTLDLSGNQLTGAIPSGLGDLSNLTTLNLSTNQLSGPIPSELGGLSSLGTLNLSTNQLSGPIPSELGGLSSLGTLDLSTNQLHGVIPSELGHLSSLITLNLSKNGLTGPIPSELRGLSSLSALNLSDNGLSGSIPSWLGNLSNLTILNLYDNELDWEIPEELNQLDKLEQVRLNDNFGLVGPAHLDFSSLSEAYLGYMETETWAVAEFSSATTLTLSGRDSGKFAITSDGVLTFTSASDFEVPSSSNSSNEYLVEVTASVGGGQNTAQIYVKVMDREFVLSVSPDSIDEDASSTPFAVTATRDNGTATTITLSLLGTATGSGTDYTAVVPLQMTIPAAAPTGTATLSITPKTDLIVEGEETIRIEGTVSGSIVSPAWITINDKDKGTLSLSVPDTDVAEDKAVAEDPDTSFEVTVALSHAIGPEVTVVWSVTPDSATSDDYCIRPGTLNDDCIYMGTLTFPAGSAVDSEESFTIFVKDDDLSEVAESFTVSLGAVTGDISDSISVDTQANSAGVTIESSDPITVTLSGDSSVDEGEWVNYTVSLDGVTPTADLTVAYATGDPDDTAGSDDYQEESGTLTFTSSDAEDKPVTVRTSEDSIAEGKENFSFGLSGVTGGGGPTPSLGESPSITTTIDDDDAEPTAITLSVDSDEVSEGDSMATTVTLTATLEGGTTRNTATTVALSLSGTATATGSGADYTAVVPSEMTIPAEAATGTATLSITPKTDEIVEGDETIGVEGAVDGFTVSPAEITINDGDQGTLSLSVPDTDVAEDKAVAEDPDTSFEVTVALSHAIGPEVTVVWSVTPDSATSDDYCIRPGTLNDDCIYLGTLTFPAGSAVNSTKSFDISVVDDKLSEGDESFTVILGAVTGDISDSISVDPQARSAELTITGSDPIKVTLWGDSSVDEGGLASYTVSLDGVTPTADLTVAYATGDPDDTAGSDDYQEESGTLTFTSSDAAVKTVTVQSTEDSIVEDDETFSFGLANVDGGGGPTPSLDDPPSITTIIIDDDRRGTPRPPANDAPTFNEGATTTRVALENSEVGTEVGEPVRATDRDGDRLEYRLQGTDLASFHLDPLTGQLTTASLLDYETQSEYSVRVRVRDGEGGIDGIDVTITIVDLDEAPSQPGAPEVRSTGPTGLAVSWTAPDNQGPEITDYDVRYREAGGEFQDAEFVGADTSITLNNLKSGTSYEVQVRAVNAEGVSPWSESGRDETEEAPPTPTPTPSPEPTPSPSPEPTPTPALKTVPPVTQLPSRPSRPRPRPLPSRPSRPRPRPRPLRWKRLNLQQRRPRRLPSRPDPPGLLYQLQRFCLLLHQPQNPRRPQHQRRSLRGFLCQCPRTRLRSHPHPQWSQYRPRETSETEDSLGGSS